MVHRFWSSNYLFPARGRKPLELDETLAELLGSNYLFPARGRKHKRVLRIITDSIKVTFQLPIPRKGTETTVTEEGTIE